MAVDDVREEKSLLEFSKVADSQQIEKSCHKAVGPSVVAIEGIVDPRRSVASNHSRPDNAEVGIVALDVFGHEFARRKKNG